MHLSLAVVPCIYAPPTGPCLFAILIYMYRNRYSVLTKLEASSWSVVMRAVVLPCSSPPLLHPHDERPHDGAPISSYEATSHHITSHVLFQVPTFSLRLLIPPCIQRSLHPLPHQVGPGSQVVRVVHVQAFHLQRIPLGDGLYNERTPRITFVRRAPGERGRCNVQRQCT